MRKRSLKEDMLDVHVQHIRKKIESNPKNLRYLQTVRGYRFAES
jgi:DNA-binding response OmpR family regulator